MKKMLQAFLREQDGQYVVEYALLAAFVAAAGGSILPAVSGSVKTLFAKMSAFAAGVDPATVARVETDTPIRIICTILAILILVVIIARRKNQQGD